MRGWGASRGSIASGIRRKNGIEHNVFEADSEETSASRHTHLQGPSAFARACWSASPGIRPIETERLTVTAAVSVVELRKATAQWPQVEQVSNVRDQV